jgi:hypothetical protein
MAIQTTIDAADAVAALLNGAGLSEPIAYARTFVPEFEPAELTAPKGLVYPATLSVARVDRSSFSEDNGIEVGIGRTIANETTDVEIHLLTVEEVKDVLLDVDNKKITTPVDGEELTLSGEIEVVLFVPELFRMGVALSVIRIEYRGFQ